MEEKILKLLGRKSYVPSNVPELLRALKMPRNSQQKLQAALKQLATSGRVVRVKGNRYILPDEADLIPGRIQITRSGRGFLTPDDPGKVEISIPARMTGTALHDDRVLVRLDVRARTREGHSGEVVRILERRRSQIVGTLKRGRDFLYVVPDDPRMPYDVYVPPVRDVGRPARAGDKVVVELRNWESRHVNPEGEIVEVLGPPTAEGVDMLSVLRQYDLPLKFPRKVLQEAKSFGKIVTDSDLAGRKDCRKHNVITIDPADAKDFDDAICVQRIKEGGWKLWVHIADVSHYVKPGTALDQEAWQRGNSTYLVDRVIPMLPEALSNELCSLKPNVDRLSKCVEFVIGADGQVKRSRCYPAVIHSKRRFSYEEAYELIQQQNPSDEIERMLCEANRLAQKIRKLRFKNGSLELDFPETKIWLDKRGRVDRIEKLENDESHQLIEEFMLLANEAVAGRLIKLNRASIHRVHERPDPDRLKDYREEVISHGIYCGNLEKPLEVQRLLKRLGKLAIGPALKLGLLKSLMRARYSVESLGHYGLAKSKYAHFTSPIRRYADLVVHRSLFEKGAGTRSWLAKTAEHISATERNSADAERDSKSVKLFAYLQAQLTAGEPEAFRAMVTDVRNFGFGVDVVDLGMRGMVPLSVLEDDFYEYDPVRSRVEGRRTRRSIQLGDWVEVEVAKVDSFKKQVDFRLVPSEEPPKRKRTRGAGRSNASKKKRSTVEGREKKARRGAKKTSRGKTRRESPKGRKGKRDRKGRK